MKDRIYSLYPHDDYNIFFEICAEFEKTYPEYEKQELIKDPLDYELYQHYTHNGSEVLIEVERIWLCEVIARADIDLSEFECSMQKKYGFEQRIIKRKPPRSFLTVEAFLPEVILFR